VASPSSLSFGNQTVNTASAAQTVTLTNAGDEPVTNANGFYFNGYYSSSQWFQRDRQLPGHLACRRKLPDPGDLCAR
jgi:hypothetical protein